MLYSRIFIHLYSYIFIHLYSCIIITHFIFCIFCRWSAVDVWDNHLLLLSVHSSLCYVVIVSGQIEFVSSDSREMYSSRGSNDQREEMNLGTSRTQQQLLDVGEEERLHLDAVAGGGYGGGDGGTACARLHLGAGQEEPLCVGGSRAPALLQRRQRLGRGRRWRWRAEVEMEVEGGGEGGGGDGGGGRR
ncbi:uncharacterized protein LOC125507155 [Triticum urartu]|uniref:uncharacterized protein LOC125507155 n=1 Tax=Triticum urartu TaxID=4572 RepID=UPI002042D326|nr:uncharacterized protein LOC125507155 [Triticum urartu]